MLAPSLLNACSMRWEPQFCAALCQIRPCPDTRCRGSSWLIGAALALAISLVPETAQACGGFFCSQAQPVNQAAERIVFADNGDGTVTAVIEIQYQGPSQSFSWLLPISSVPMGDEIAVSSNAAFQRLQAATNPQYQLTTRVEGVCDVRPESDRNFAAGSGAPTSADDDDGSGVVVEASGQVGSFEWTVISLDDALSDPAAAAVEWLGQNGYDVPDGAPGLLGPYLADGMNLLALKLQKGFDAGSIRPIVLTYEGTEASIPIKLTAVAANEDMGVMTWILGAARAVPRNYNALELNEARINWFNPSPTYNDVVIAAANEAGGQGFVTEYTQPSSELDQLVWSDAEEADWQSIYTTASNGQEVYLQTAYRYASFDGYFEALQAHATLPSNVDRTALAQCPDCYQVAIADPAAFLASLEAQVIEPVRLVQRLIDSYPQITRLYTTLSAEEMTVDPLFTFNPDLDTVSNVHTAERVIECRQGYYEDSAPWRIELPGGGVVRGGPSQLGNWPTAFDEQPANQRVLRYGQSGPGQVLEDNSPAIADSIGEYNSTIPTPPRNDSGCGCVVAPKHGVTGFVAGFLLWAGVMGQRLRRLRRSSKRKGSMS
jgi:hypothetical protein